ncbi:2',3'-cyclic-nucleotide 2'-phosphodiesterase [Azospirillaceae bacterium]
MSQAPQYRKKTPRRQTESTPMRIVFLGDIVGRSGRDAVLQFLPRIKTELAPDAIIVNGENAAGGFGITDKIAQEFFAAGIDAITLGNHVWDQKELVTTIDREPRLFRPLNYPDNTPGRGCGVITTRTGRKVLVITLILRLFMDLADDPFAAVERVLRLYRLGCGGIDAIVVDAHGEATSEKMAMGHFLDGRVSLIAGSHSHIPTADWMILSGGSAYITDAGMCGDYNSVIGMKKENAVTRFLRRVPTERMSPSDGEGTVCGVMIDTNAQTGLARRIAPIRIGGKWLSGAFPNTLDTET